MNLLMVARNDGADSFFRIVAPGRMLRYNGYDVEVRALRHDDPENCDWLVLNRHETADVVLLVEEFKRAGRRVVYDVDDWLQSVPPSVY